MKSARLGDVCYLEKGQSITKKQITEGNVPVVAGGQQAAYYHNVANRQADTITISASGAYAGFANYWSVPIFASDCTTVRPKTSEIDVSYLYKFLKANQSYLYSLQRGAGQPHVYGKDIENIEVPLPPLETQKKIAAVLDKAQELIDKRTEQLAKMDEFVQSVFLEIFGDVDVDVNPNGWNKQQLKQHLLSIDSGWSPNCNDYPAPLGEWGVLKLSAVTGGEYKETENKALPVELQPKGNIEVHVGDLLVTRKNTRQLVGACAYVMNTQPCLMLPDTIFRFNTKDSINKVFLWKLFNDYKFKKIVQNLASGSAGSMPNISKGKLMALEIPLPPLDLQTQFAAIVEKTEQQKALMQQSLAQMETTMSSLMQRAFKGELF